MPNYPTHARWGRLGAVLAAVAAGGLVYVGFETAAVAAAAAAGAAGAAFVGAVFPDIDHHASVPRQKATRALQGLVVAGVGALAALRAETLVAVADDAVTVLDAGVPPEAVAGGVVVVAALVLTGAVDPTIGLVTRRHRGWTHSVAATLGLTVALAAGAVAMTLDQRAAERAASVAVVGAFYLGVLVHLGLDGEIG